MNSVEDKDLQALAKDIKEGLIDAKGIGYRYHLTATNRDVRQSDAEKRWYLMVPEEINDYPVVFSLGLVGAIVGGVDTDSTVIHNKYDGPVPDLFVKDLGTGLNNGDEYDYSTGVAVQQFYWKTGVSNNGEIINSTNPDRYGRKANTSGYIDDGNGGSQLKNEYTAILKVPSGYTSYDEYPIQFKGSLENLKLVADNNTPDATANNGPMYLKISNNTNIPLKFGDYKNDDTVNAYAVIDDYVPGNGDFTGGGSQTFTVYIKDLKKVQSITHSSSDPSRLPLTDDLIRLVYQAGLTDDAVAGPAGNKASVQVAVGDNPEDPTSISDLSAPSNAKTFTNKIVIHKVDSDNQPFTGSTWELRKTINSGNGATVTGGQLIENTDGTADPYFVWNAIDEGTYTLGELTTRTADGYTVMPQKLTFRIVETVTAGIPDTSPTGTQEVLTLAISSNTLLPASILGKNLYVTSMDDTTVYADFCDVTTGEVTFKIRNYRPNELPSTGGMGLWTVAGVASLALLGFVITATIKKKVVG